MVKLSEVRKLNARNARKARKANPPAPTTGVNGGFRAGKRKRGNSLLKQTPATSRVANITRAQLEAAPNDAVMYGYVRRDGVEVGRLLKYRSDQA